MAIAHLMPSRLDRIDATLMTMIVASVVTLLLTTPLTYASPELDAEL